MNTIMNESFFYRLYGQILDGIALGYRNSGLRLLIVWLVARWRQYKDGSAAVRACSRIADGVGASIQNSVLVNRFLLPEDNRVVADSAVLRPAAAVVRGLRKLFFALRLDKLFTGSIFAKPWIWCCLTVILLPLLPTMGALALVLVSFVSLLLAFFLDRERQLRYFAINKYIGLFTLFYLLATLTSVAGSGSFKIGAITVCFILFALALMNSVETRGQLRVLLAGIVAVGAAVSLYGVYQFFFYDASGAWLDSEMFSYSMRVYSTFSNPNVLGEYFLLAIPLALGGVLISRTGRSRLFFICGAGLMVICMLLTYSRGAYLGFIFAVAVFLILYDRRFIVPGIILAAVVLLAMPSTIIDRLFSIGDMRDSSTSYRVYIWMGTLAMLKVYWPCGIGPGQVAFDMVYPVYSYGAVSAPHAHNLFLQMMCDMGIFGVLVFVAILYQFYKSTFAALKKKEDRTGRILIISAIASVTGFLVQSMTDYTFYNYRVMLLFWTVLALGILFTRYDGLKEDSSV